MDHEGDDDYDDGDGDDIACSSSATRMISTMMVMKQRNEDRPSQ